MRTKTEKSPQHGAHIVVMSLELGFSESLVQFLTGIHGQMTETGDSNSDIDSLLGDPLNDRMGFTFCW